MGWRLATHGVLSVFFDPSTSCWVTHILGALPTHCHLPRVEFWKAEALLVFGEEGATALAPRSHLRHNMLLQSKFILLLQRVEVGGELVCHLLLLLVLRVNLLFSRCGSELLRDYVFVPLVHNQSVVVNAHDGGTYRAQRVKRGTQQRAAGAHSRWQW